MSNDKHNDNKNGCCHSPSKSEMLVSHARDVSKMANFWLNQNRPDITAGLLEQAVKLLDLANQPREPMHIKLLTLQADVALRQGDAQKSYEYCQKSCLLAADIFGAEHPAYAVARSNMGEVMIKLGRVHDGVAVIKDCLVFLEADGAIEGSQTQKRFPHAASYFRNLLKSIGAV